MKSSSSHKPLTRSLSINVFSALTLTISSVSTLYAGDDRVSWDNGGADNEFTNAANWSDFEGTTPVGAASDQLPGWRSTGGNSNAIIQGASVTGANAPVLNSDFTPAFNFNPLIVRGEAQLTINAQLNIANTQFWTAQTNPNNLVTQNAPGSVIARDLFMGVSGGTGTYNMNGGSITLSGQLDNTRTLGSNFNFGVGGNGQNVSLTANAVVIDNANNNIFTVGSGSILHLTGGTSSFADGFQVVGDGVLSGTGTISSAIGVSGVISPGNSPGTLITGSEVWSDGGSYLWEINNSAGTQGADPGWDWLDIIGGLDLNGLSAGGFEIDITSLTSGNVAGDADGFDMFINADGIVDYSFVIASASTGISGFDAADFVLDSSAFTNDLTGDPYWDWQIAVDGNNLVLQASAVPEPSSMALLGLGGLALMLRRKR